MATQNSGQMFGTAADDRPYPARTGTLTRNLNDVTPEWLTGLMRNRYPGIVIHGWEVLDLRNGHTTKMRVKLDMNAAGHAAGIPEHVCLKANWSGGFAEVDIHALEARFYHHARDAMKVPSPVGYYADWDDSGQGVVVMEDLVHAGGSFGHSTDDMGIDKCAEAMLAYAGFHGASWGDPRLKAMHWLPESMNTPIDCDQLRFMWQWVEKNIGKPEYQAMLPAWFNDDPQRLHRVFDGLSRFEQRQTGAHSIVHGDSHQGNGYVRTSGERIWIDFQLVRRGRPWRDLAYFMVGALTIEERRGNDRRLLGIYRDALIAGGAQGVPSLDEIWQAYIRFPVYGAQAWIANMDEWGQTGFPMAERFFTAMADFDTAKLLEAED